MGDTDLKVEIDRTLPARPETVFRALTEPELYGQWMGPPGSTTVVEELDARIGGRLAFRVSLPEHDMEFLIHGFYEEIEPPRRLVHSWMVEGDDAVSTVVFALEPVGDATRLQITHHGLTTPEDVSQNSGGWSMQVDRLEELLTSLT
jgi:uncharacterized protein YndB with AHSA1/START domain